MPGWNEGESPPVPDLAGTIRCYKDMSLVTSFVSAADGLPEWTGLRSLTFGMPWDAGVQTAACNRYRSSGGSSPCGLCRAAPAEAAPLHATPAPDEHCACGFYAWHRPDPPQAARDMYTWEARVLAVCEASGVIIPHQLGLRAQYMKVVAFRLLEVPTRRLDFGIPQFFTAEEMLEAYPPTDDIQAATGKTPAQMQAEWEESHLPGQCIPGNFSIYRPPAYITPQVLHYLPAGATFQLAPGSFIIGSD